MNSTPTIIAGQHLFVRPFCFPGAVAVPDRTRREGERKNTKKKRCQASSTDQEDAHRMRGTSEPGTLVDSIYQLVPSERHHHRGCRRRRHARAGLDSRPIAHVISIYLQVTYLVCTQTRPTQTRNQRECAWTLDKHTPRWTSA